MSNHTEKNNSSQGYYYIIPTLLVEEGNSTKALLYGLITSLVNNKGYCWASNSYLAKKLGKKDGSTISKYISELETEGWIKTVLENKTDRKIYIGNLNTLRKKPKGVEEISTGGIGKNRRGVEEKTADSIKRKKEKEEVISPPLNTDLEFKLNQLNKGGHFSPGRKLLISVLDISEYEAKDIEKELKSMDLVNRENYLKDVVTQNGKPKKSYNSKPKYNNNNTKEDEEKDLPEVTFDDLPKSGQDEILALKGLFENNSDQKVPIYDIDVRHYSKTRQMFKFEEIMYVARNCIRATKRGENFYSLTFKTMVKEKTIARLISDPYLAELEKE